jgi:23S rRNA A2030 N6-methylase RlmJ
MATKESNYDHGDHVGNKGDVVKHTVLIAVLDVLLKSPGSEEFTFCDAFSGYGEYPLDSEKREWKTGVKALYEKKSTNSYIKNYLGACFAKDKNGEIHYPGSSVIAAMRAARAGRKLSVKAWDTNEECTENLRKVLEAQWPRINVDVQNKEMLADDAKGANLLFIDPPDRKGGKETLEKISGHGDDIPPLLIWLPVYCGNSKNQGWQPNIGLQPPETMNQHKLLSFHVLWGAPKNTLTMAGCEMLGWNLGESAWKAARKAAKEVADEMVWRCV